MVPLPEAAGLQDLLLRLDGKVKALGHAAPQDAERQLLRDCIAMLKMQAVTNADFNRRVQALEAKDGHNQLVAKLRGDVAFSRNWALSSNQRMSSAFKEIKIINDQIRRVRDDGCSDDVGYHSVMDSRQDGGPTVPGQVWANRFISRKGGCVSTRPAEAIVEIIDELILLRGQKSLKEGIRGAEAVASGDKIIPDLIKVHKLALAAAQAKPDDMGATFSTREDLGRAAFSIADAVLAAMIEIERLRAMNPDTSKLHPRIAAARAEKP